MDLQHPSQQQQANRPPTYNGQPDSRNNKLPSFGFSRPPPPNDRPPLQYDSLGRREHAPAPTPTPYGYSQSNFTSDAPQTASVQSVAPFGHRSSTVSGGIHSRQSSQGSGVRYPDLGWREQLARPSGGVCQSFIMFRCFTASFPKVRGLIRASPAGHMCVCDSRRHGITSSDAGITTKKAYRNSPTQPPQRSQHSASPSEFLTLSKYYDHYSSILCLDRYFSADLQGLATTLNRGSTSPFST